jgi:ATP-dependent DNA ligase
MLVIEMILFCRLRPGDTSESVGVELEHEGVVAKKLKAPYFPGKRVGSRL